MRHSIRALAVLMLAGCVTYPVHKENAVPQPIVLPTNMCAQRGTVAKSLGNEGERMECELQMHIGSHVAQCVCRDQGTIIAQTQETQDLLQRLEMQPKFNENN